MSTHKQMYDKKNLNRLNWKSLKATLRSVKDYRSNAHCSKVKKTCQKKRNLENKKNQKLGMKRTLKAEKRNWKENAQI